MKHIYILLLAVLSLNISQVQAQDPSDCNCYTLYDPVCSADGITYSNSCFAACEGVEEFTMGECAELVPIITAHVGELFSYSQNLGPNTMPVDGPSLFLYESPDWADANIVTTNFDGVTNSFGSWLLEIEGTPTINDQGANYFVVASTSPWTGEIMIEDTITVSVIMNCICPAVAAPVCGVDGNTYGNSCEAACANVEIAYDGLCNESSNCIADVEIISQEVINGFAGPMLHLQVMNVGADLEGISTNVNLGICPSDDYFTFTAWAEGEVMDMYYNFACLSMAPYIEPYEAQLILSGNANCADSFPFEFDPQGGNMTEGCTDADGTFYANGQEWNQDDCTFCSCENGEIMCMVVDCAMPPCDNPVYIDGQCCPVCEEEGCTDPQALNFSFEAIIDDGSCEYDYNENYCNFLGNEVSFGEMVYYEDEYCTCENASLLPAWGFVTENLHMSCEPAGCTLDDGTFYAVGESMDGDCETCMCSPSLTQVYPPDPPSWTCFEIADCGDCAEVICPPGTLCQNGDCIPDETYMHCVADNGEAFPIGYAMEGECETCICTESFLDVYPPAPPTWQCFEIADCGMVYGCTNPDAFNYNPEATFDDGSCVIPGSCIDADGVSYAIGDVYTENCEACECVEMLSIPGMPALGSWQCEEIAGCEESCELYTLTWSQSWDGNFSNGTFYGMVSDSEVGEFELIGQNETNGQIEYCLTPGCYTITAWVNGQNSAQSFELTNAVGELVLASEVFYGDYEYFTFSHATELTCEDNIVGCTDQSAYNYDDNATVDDGSCIPIVYGCTNYMALNYNPEAVYDDGSCEFNQDCGEWGELVTINVAGEYPSNYTGWNLSGTYYAFGGGITQLCLWEGCYDFGMNSGTPEHWENTSVLITDSQGNELLNLENGHIGSASFAVNSQQECNESVYYIPGCIDENALNYDPNANYNYGCEYDVYGCTDPTAINFNQEATVDDGSCIPIVYGCTNPMALNYDEQANVDNFTCILYCSAPDGSVYLQGESYTEGCISYTCVPEMVSPENEPNIDPLICVLDIYSNCIWQLDTIAGCEEEEYGCTNPIAINNNPLATIDDGSCEFLDADNSIMLGNAVENCCVEAYVGWDGYTGLWICAQDFQPDCYNIFDVFGCTDLTAFNYNSDATVDDGSCIPYSACLECEINAWAGFPVCGSNGVTYENTCYAECMGITEYYLGECDSISLEEYGCTSDNGDYYPVGGTLNEGCVTCVCVELYYPWEQPTVWECEEIADCEEEVYGCTDPIAINYNAEATVDDGSCISLVYCMANGETYTVGESYIEGCEEYTCVDNPILNEDDLICYDDIPLCLWDISTIADCEEEVYGCTSEEGVLYPVGSTMQGECETCVCEDQGIIANNPYWNCFEIADCGGTEEFGCTSANGEFYPIGAMMEGDCEACICTMSMDAVFPPETYWECEVIADCGGFNADCPGATFEEEMYLPDGAGTAYTTSVMLEAAEGQVLTDIDNFTVSINIEHSYIGDLDIYLTAPNGQQVQLFDQGCGGTWFGEATDGDATDSNPGVGYDYGWSMNPSYNGTMLDGCNDNTLENPNSFANTLASGTYLPVESFELLEGAPLNGLWELTVVDNIMIDNGWVFSWGISLCEGEDEIYGCTDSLAVNYNPEATFDDGSCLVDCVCPMVYSPVCGSDGITYGNACEAECVGVIEYYEGACLPTSFCDLLEVEAETMYDNNGQVQLNITVYNNSPNAINYPQFNIGSVNSYVNITPLYENAYYIGAGESTTNSYQVTGGGNMSMMIEASYYIGAMNQNAACNYPFTFVYEPLWGGQYCYNNGDAYEIGEVLTGPDWCETCVCVASDALAINEPGSWACETIPGCGGANSCDSLSITSTNVNAEGMLEVFLSNTNIYSYYSYPQLNVIDENGQILAQEETFYYGIGTESMHSLEILVPMSEWPANTMLQVNTNFGNEFACQMPISFEDPCNLIDCAPGFDCVNGDCVPTEPQEFGCTDDAGNFYAFGEIMQQDCNTCTCTPGFNPNAEGFWMCTMMPCEEECLEGETSYELVMNFNGMDAGSFTVNVGDETYSVGQPENGLTAVINFCAAPGECIEVSALQTWMGPPFTHSLYANGVLVSENEYQYNCDTEEVYGCTVPEAVNYNPDATVDDGSCEFGSVCNLDIEILYHGLLLVEGQPVTEEYYHMQLVNNGDDLSNLSFSLYFDENIGLYSNAVINVEDWQSGDTLDLEFLTNWGISIFPGFETESYLGVSFGNGCYEAISIEPMFMMYGCTDPEAINHNPWATIDDGSCEYEIIGCELDGEFYAFGETVQMGCNSCFCEPGFNPNESGYWACTEMACGGCTDPEALNYDEFAQFDDGSCEYGADATIPNWDYPLTGSNHTIVIPENVLVDLNGMSLESGDWMGVFYQVDGQSNPGGYVVWDANTTMIAAQGDDLTTTEIDGFQNGEQFQWMLWDESENVIYLMEATYAAPGQEVFAVNGISTLVSLTAVPLIAEQALALENGWNMFSTYMATDDLLISEVFADYVQHVIIAKNNVGEAWLPDYNYDGIGLMQSGQGYQCKLNTAMDIVIEGDYLTPEDNPIALENGWNMIAYYPITGYDVIEVFADIEDLVIVKDNTGMAYLPEYDFNGIGTMQAGKAYQVKVLSDQILQYPANE